MKNVKLIYTDYHNSEIYCKTINELKPYEQQESVKLIIDTLSIAQKVQLLKDLKIEEAKEMIEYLRSIGYVPITKIEKIPELTIPQPNQLYYQNSGWVKTFNIAKNDLAYNDAVPVEAHLFVNVEILNSHPFRQAQIRFKKKQDEIKQDKAIKKRQKEIEKARKLLEENKK